MPRCPLCVSGEDEVLAGERDIERVDEGIGEEDPRMVFQRAAARTFILRSWLVLEEYLGRV